MAKISHEKLFLFMFAICWHSIKVLYHSNEDRKLFGFARHQQNGKNGQIKTHVKTSKHQITVLERITISTLFPFLRLHIRSKNEVSKTAEKYSNETLIYKFVTLIESSLLAVKIVESTDIFNTIIIECAYVCWINSK